MKWLLVREEVGQWLSKDKLGPGQVPNANYACPLPILDHNLVDVCPYSREVWY